MPSFGAVMTVNEIGPYMGGGEAVYRVTGDLVDKPLDFPSLAEAKRAVEKLVRDNGDTIQGDQGRRVVVA